MILDVMETCENVALSNYLVIVKRALLLIQIIVPILLIVMTIFQFTSMINNPDDKNGFKKLKNKILAAIIVFTIPFIVNAVMGVLGESTEFSNCWNKAGDIVSGDSQYIDVYDDEGKKSNPIGGNYQKSTKKNTASTTNNTNTNTTAVSKVIFVGDSRTVGMYAYKSGNWSGDYSKSGANELDSDVFIAETGKGLSWLKSTGMPAAESYMGSGSAVVILMGVNDVSNVDGYISYLKSNASTWTSNGTKMYFSAVTQCSGSSNYLNTSIQNFNSKLKSNLPSGITWIDTYSYLSSNGYTTTDGIHYDKDTSNKIYNYIKSAV